MIIEHCTEYSQKWLNWHIDEFFSKYKQNRFAKLQTVGVPVSPKRMIMSTTLLYTIIKI